jgi:hypothetical protein
VRPWSAVLAIVAALLCAKTIAILRFASGPSAAREADLEARRRAVLPRVQGGDVGLAPASSRFRGEWRAVAASMTALASAQLAARDPSRRTRALRDVTALAEALRLEDAWRFDADAWGGEPLRSAGDHAGYLGHLGLVLVAERALGGHAHDALAIEVASALERALVARDGDLVETYPGERYVPDCAVVLAVLALHARADGAPPPPVLARSVARLRAEYTDPATGLLRFAPGAPARGSGAAWSAYYLGFVDAAFAREQAAALERVLLRELPFGAAALLETPDGGDGGDVDSGPLVLGASPAGTGFAIGALRQAGRDATALRLERTAELVGTTVSGPRGRSYLLAPLVGDAILVAMRSAGAWPAR